MASSNDDVVTEKRLVFRDCKQRRLAYLAVAKAAGFRLNAIQGRLVANIELYPKKPRRPRKPGGLRSKRRRTGGR